MSVFAPSLLTTKSVDISDVSYYHTMRGDMNWMYNANIVRITPDEEYGQIVTLLRNNTSASLVDYFWMDLYVPIRISAYIMRVSDGGNTLNNQTCLGFGSESGYYVVSLTNSQLVIRESGVGEELSVKSATSVSTDWGTWYKLELTVTAESLVGKLYSTDNELLATTTYETTIFDGYALNELLLQLGYNIITISYYKDITIELI